MESKVDPLELSPLDLKVLNFLLGWAGHGLGKAESHSTGIEDGEARLEYWHHRKKLTLYFSAESTKYVKV